MNKTNQRKSGEYFSQSPYTPTTTNSNVNTNIGSNRSQYSASISTPPSNSPSQHHQRNRQCQLNNNPGKCKKEGFRILFYRVSSTLFFQMIANGILHLIEDWWQLNKTLPIAIFTTIEFFKKSKKRHIINVENADNSMIMISIDNSFSCLGVYV